MFPHKLFAHKSLSPALLCVGGSEDTALQASMEQDRKGTCPGSHPGELVYERAARAGVLQGTHT